MGPQNEAVIFFELQLCSLFCSLVWRLSPLLETLTIAPQPKNKHNHYSKRKNQYDQADLIETINTLTDLSTIYKPGC